MLTKEKCLCPECAGTGIELEATEDSPTVFCPVCKGMGEVYE